MTITVSNVATTDTFGSWLTKTNTLATIASQNAVTVDTTSSGSISTGNAYVNGHFGANTLVAYTGVAGGSLAAGNTLNLITNTAFTYTGSNLVSFNANATFSNVVITTNAVYIVPTGGNTTIGGNFLNINVSTTNVTSTSLNANSVLTLTGNATIKANSSFNSISITGNSSAVTFLANTTNATFVSNVSFSNSIIIANTANTNRLNVYGATTSNIAGDLRIEGSVSIGGNLAYSGTTGGDIIPASNNFYRLGNTTNRFADVYSNNFFGTTVNTVSLVVTGNTSFANNILPSSNNTYGVGNSSNYWNISYVSNTVSNNVIISNNVYVPAGNASSPAVTFTGNTDTGIFRSATATLAVAAAGTQKLTVNATTVAVNAAITASNTASFTGNVTFSNTIAGTGNVTFSNTVAITGVTTISSNVATSGTILINSVAHQFANTYTFTNSTTTANIDTVSASLYRSYEYTVQLSDTSVTPTPYYHVTKIAIIHDGSTPYLTEYGTLFNVASLGTFDAIINGGNIALQLTPTTANVVAKFVRTSIVP